MAHTKGSYKKAGRPSKAAKKKAIKSHKKK